MYFLKWRLLCIASHFTDEDFCGYVLASTVRKPLAELTITVRWRIYFDLLSNELNFLKYTFEFTEVHLRFQAAINDWTFKNQKILFNYMSWLAMVKISYLIKSAWCIYAAVNCVSFKNWFVAWTLSSSHRNQCCLNVNWVLRKLF